MKTSELTGAALDWAVAKCEGHAVAVMTVEEQRTRWFEHVDPKDLEKERRDFDQYILPTLKPELTVVGEGNYKRTPTHAEAPMLWGQGIPHFAYGTSWSQGGPIIEREGICLLTWYPEWSAHKSSGPTAARRISGPTPLIAAMRCYVASKLGDEVNIPAELIS